MTMVLGAALAAPLFGDHINYSCVPGYFTAIDILGGFVGHCLISPQI